MKARYVYVKPKQNRNQCCSRQKQCCSTFVPAIFIYMWNKLGINIEKVEQCWNKWWFYIFQAQTYECIFKCEEKQILIAIFTSIFSWTNDYDGGLGHCIERNRNQTFSNKFSALIKLSSVRWSVKLTHWTQRNGVFECVFFFCQIPTVNENNISVQLKWKSWYFSWFLIYFWKFKNANMKRKRLR